MEGFLFIWVLILDTMSLFIMLVAVKIIYETRKKEYEDPGILQTRFLINLGIAFLIFYMLSDFFSVIGIMSETMQRLQVIFLSIAAFSFLVSALLFMRLSRVFFQKRAIKK